MTGNELRQQVCAIMNSWIGATKGSAKHTEILRIYNGHTPLACGYAMQTYDAYCAATVSAAWIKAGVAAYTGTECSVPRFVTIAQNKGIWMENDGYVPKLGDAVCYDWGDGANYATTDNRGEPDHIGIVTQVNGAMSFVVTEGNMSGGRTGTQTLAVNGRYIRGFIVPDYDAIAKALGGSGSANTAQEEASAPETSKVEFETAKTYRNGSTSEPVYADTARTVKIGSLNPWEECDCLGTVGGMYIVRYRVDGTTGHKVGLVVYSGGVV